MRKRYLINKEKMDGEWYWTIYRKTWFGKRFFERWHSIVLATIRLEELNNPLHLMIPVDGLQVKSERWKDATRIRLGRYGK